MRPGHRVDAVSALTLYLIVSACIPSVLIVGPIGASGTPANLIGAAFLMWWILAKLGTGQGVDRRPQPVRIALLLLFMAVLASYVVLNLRPRLGTETLASGRGLIFLAAMSGVALLAADGITSLARLHTLLRRVVHAAAFVALTAVVQFFTGFNASASINVPGLVRNTLVGDHDRSLFVRAQGTATHPIELGGLLGFVLPVAVHYALMARGRRAKVIAWAEVVTIATALIMAISRTGAVAAAIGLISLSFEWSWRRRGKALAATFGFLVVLRGLVPGLVGTLTSSFTKINEDTSTQDRVSRYAIAGHYFRQHPWFGRGFATLYPATHQVFDNTWLYVATELGVFGVVALVLFFLIMIFTARGARMRSTELLTHGAAQALVGMLVAAMITFATADLLGFNMLMGFFFLMAGAAGAMWRLTGGSSDFPPQPRRAFRSWTLAEEPEPESPRPFSAEVSPR